MISDVNLYVYFLRTSLLALGSFLEQSINFQGLEMNPFPQECSRFPQWLNSKESACSGGDVGLIPGSGRSPGGGHGNPLQYSSLENPMDRGACQARDLRVAESQIRLKQLGTHP